MDVEKGNRKRRQSGAGLDKFEEIKIGLMSKYWYYRARLPLFLLLLLLLLLLLPAEQIIHS